MKYRKLGRTDLNVSEIGFGAWAIGGPAKLGNKNIGWGQVKDSDSIKALEALLDNGVNFIDTADVYGWGHSEELVGKVFSSKRDKVIIATKVGNRVDANGSWIKDFSGKWVKKAVEKSLQRLETDYIDLYQFHTPNVDYNFTESVFDAFDQLKADGKIRFYGVSIGPVLHGLQVLKFDKADVIQVVHNILEPEPEKELFAECKKNNIGIIARVPLASGFLTGKFNKDSQFHFDDHRSEWSEQKISKTIDIVDILQFLEKNNKTLAQAALQYCLAFSQVSTVIPGAKSIDQVRMNALASDLVQLTDLELTKIKEIQKEF